MDGKHTGCLGEEPGEKKHAGQGSQKAAVVGGQAQGYCLQVSVSLRFSDEITAGGRAGGALQGVSSRLWERRMTCLCPLVLPWLEANKVNE